jgi:uncharacterized protein YjbI with pentapeptide repeats
MANLSGAKLFNANLSPVMLILTNLSDANLEDADLSGAKFLGADLSGVVHLTQAQLDQACGETELPEGLTLKPCSTH